MIKFQTFWIPQNTLNWQFCSLHPFLHPCFTKVSESMNDPFCLPKFWYATFVISRIPYIVRFILEAFVLCHCPGSIYQLWIQIIFSYYGLIIFGEVDNTILLFSFRNFQDFDIIDFFSNKRRNYFKFQNVLFSCFSGFYNLI